MNGLTAVADTGPLNYLAIIDCFELLPKLFETVYVPTVVQAELLHPKAPAKAQHWMRTPPGWLTIAEPKAKPKFSQLHLGEAAALQLAIELSANALLIDEENGRRAARELHLQQFGTLGVLETAARFGFVDLRSVFDRLRNTNFFASEDLYNAALRRDEQFRKK
jgi:hypothetical protein